MPDPIPAVLRLAHCAARCACLTPAAEAAIAAAFTDGSWPADCPAAVTASLATAGYVTPDCEPDFTAIVEAQQRYLAAGGGDLGAVPAHVFGAVLVIHQAGAAAGLSPPATLALALYITSCGWSWNTWPPAERTRARAELRRAGFLDSTTPDFEAITAAAKAGAVHRPPPRSKAKGKADRP